MTPTPRELIVLHKLSRPHASVKSVAHELGISEVAVRSRLSHLYARLGVVNALQAYAALDATSRGMDHRALRADDATVDAVTSPTSA